MPPKARRLKLNGPRRRESVRVKARAPSAASTPTSAESPGDTIEVAQKSSDGTMEEALLAPAAFKDAAATSETPVVSDGEEVLEKMDAEPTPTPTAQDKEDEAMVDADDAVTEYDFNDEKESAFDDDEDDDYGKFKDTDVDVISISSDDPPHQQDFALDPKPWLSMDRQSRAERERMFCMPPRRPIGGDWQDCEKYLEILDLEMEEYTKDFPLETWVIGRGDAERGYAQMLERRKMRSVGVGYYQREALADFSRQTMHMPPPPMPVQRQHSSHHPPSHPQVPVPQQHVSQPQPVLHGGMPYGPPQPQQVYFPGNQGLIDVGLDEQGRRIFRLAEPGEVQSMPAAPPTHAPSDTRAREQRAPSQPKAPMQAPSRSKPPKPRTQMDAAGAQVQVPVQTVTDHAGDTLAIPVVSDSSQTSSLEPPYPTRTKPAPDPAFQPKNKRKLGETAEFPWNRQIDFEGAKTQVAWRKKDLYEAVTLDKMDEVRKKNADYIDRAKLDESGKQRQSNMGMPSDGLDHSSDDDGLKQQQAKQTDDSGEGSWTTTDNNITGSFQYVSAVDRQKATDLRKKVFGDKARALPDGQCIEALMEAAGKPGFDESALQTIKIKWLPTKRTQQELVQVHFTIRDSLRTRRKLSTTPALNTEAAECIIDFCPDLLFHEFLLRILSETSITNKQLRDRLCHNGGWIDKATITKRTGSVLGKKQYTRAGEGMRSDEERYYLENARDFENYQLFFGKGRSRIKNRVGLSGKGKRLKTDDTNSSAISSRPSSSGSNGSAMVVDSVTADGRARDGVQTRSSRSNKGKGKAPVQIPQLDGAADGQHEETDVEGEDSEIAVGGRRKTMDEVSVQSDGELDRLVGDDSG